MVKIILDFSFKKLSIDYVGVCQLRQLYKGEFFRLVDKDGNVGKSTYTKGSYVTSERKYKCFNHNFISKSGRLLKGSTLVTTDFYY